MIPGRHQEGAGLLPLPPRIIVLSFSLSSSLLSLCYAIRYIRSIGEQSGPTTDRLGSTGLQAMPSEGWHSWQSGAHLPLLSSQGLATVSDDYGQGGAAGGWTSPPPPPEPQDSLWSTAGRMEQLDGHGAIERQAD